MIRNLTILTFVIVFASGLAGVRYFNHFYVENVLKNDAEKLLYQFHDALTKAREVLDSLPAPLSFSCNRQSIKQLAKLAFEHPSIRLIGVKHGDQEACASEPIDVDLSHYHDRIVSAENHQLADNLALATKENANGRLDLLMIRSHADSRYFASINPFMIDYLTEFACRNCLEYDFVIDGTPTLEFRSLPMNKPGIIQYSASRTNEMISVTLYVRGTKDLYDYYTELSWVSAIIFSAILATIFTLIANKLLRIRSSIESTIKHALKSGEFVPFFQPIVDSRNGEVVGAEVLARWQLQDGSIIPPYQFIPFAESSNLIIDITEQLIIRTVKSIKLLGWDKSEKFMSINIVPEHLKSKQLFNLIEQLRQENSIPAASISLEITERMQISDLAEARENLEDFYQQGIELKLDDAGTGYGGFSYIQELDISTLKIDKMFVDTIGKDDVKGSVLTSIISFVNTSGLKVIAEGVESEEQVQYLKERDVFLIQGYVYAKPMPVDELTGWLRNREQNT
ncbi:EAL domain-containing protein [Aliikangiella coralliicola]|nr:EAL domain-containing protein [Aliikangiella coralliicola]